MFIGSRFAFLVPFAVLMSACAMISALENQGKVARSPKCPADGTEEKLNKVFGLGEDYQGCQVRVRAKFSSVMQTFCTSSASMYRGEKDFVEFQVTTDEDPMPRGVLISKAASGPVFDMKAGDPVLITGGTVVSGHMMYCFQASAVSRPAAN